MTKIFILLVLLLATAYSSADECPMNPPPLDSGRIARLPLVKSITVDKSKLAVSALLKNGRFFRLVHSGCNHSGATATLWLETDTSIQDTAAWIKEAQSFLHLAFVPNIANSIAKCMAAKKFTIATDMSRIEIDGDIPDYMNYSIVVSSTDHGVLLIISYIIG